MENRHKDSCTAAQTFERWGDAGGYDSCLSDGSLSVWAVAQANPGYIKAEALRDVNPSGEADCPIPHCQEKPLASLPATVPQTDTGGREEYSKALGRTTLKELDQLAP